MPNLERFHLHLSWRGVEDLDKKQVVWSNIETLISDSVMPRLRRFTFIYILSSNTEIRHILQSFRLMNQTRNVHVQFGLYIKASTFIDASDMPIIYDNNIFVQINDEIASPSYCTWYTLSWPSSVMFWMNRHEITPPSNVRRLGIKAPNISLHSIHKLFPNVNQLKCYSRASLCTTDSLLRPKPLLNLHRLVVYEVIPGLELLFDGVMLPRLHSLDGCLIPIFVAFASRANQMNTLDTIKEMTITDRFGDDETCFSFKQWCTVLDAVPHLRMLTIQCCNSKCPL
ncbi:hypothetical protein I4U23_017579 [Adineta vaga]|nr:hypothetical protein I4U23_017579 [Adineta vaga]